MSFPFCIFHDSIGESKESMIFSHTHILSLMEAGSALADNNVTSNYGFTAELFNTQSLGITISTIFSCTTSRHWFPPR